MREADSPAENDPVTTAVPVTWRSGLRLRPRVLRVRDAIIPVAQVVIAATTAYLLAHVLLGHESPLLAATVAITSLGLSRDARPRRVIETVVAMLTGIFIAEAFRLAFGTGVWQLAAVLTITMLLARFLMPSPQFAISAAIQATIAMVLPVGPLPFMRLADGAVGGIFALAVTALLPRNPMRTVLRSGRQLFDAFGAACDRVIQGLSAGDEVRADRGLEKARALQADLDRWRVELESATAISQLSPFLRRRRSELLRLQEMQQAMDHATRNLRVVARRAAYVVRDHGEHPVAAGTLTQIRRAADVLSGSLDDLELRPVARSLLTDIARSLDPAVLLPGGGLGEINLIAAMRPLTVDLLQAAGYSHGDAAEIIPRI